MEANKPEFIAETLIGLIDAIDGMNKAIEEMVLNVAASNERERIASGRPWIKAHKPNLGPYSAINPCHCEDCGKPKWAWIEGEKCEAEGRDQDGKGNMVGRFNQ